jgi:hypothetical protein
MKIPQQILIKIGNGTKYFICVNLKYEEIN